MHQEADGLVNTEVKLLLIASLFSIIFIVIIITIIVLVITTFLFHY